MKTTPHYLTASKWGVQLYRRGHCWQVWNEADEQLLEFDTGAQAIVYARKITAGWHEDESEIA